MKKILLNAVFFCIAALMGSCSDFFEVNTDNTLNDEDYIDEESEIFTGYIGIMTKLQAIGDKSIYLNEARGELIEPTANAPRELISIYNYDSDLTGNSYADPAGYYEVINACNDYLSKLKTYKENYRIDNKYYKPLVSSTLRIKAWTFMTIAKIYGKVVWVDKPMTSLRDLSKFKVLSLDDTMKACKNLLDIGFDDIPGNNSNADGSINENLTTKFYYWLDRTGKEEVDLSNSPYRQWESLSPHSFVLYGEIYLWLGQYQRCINEIQGYMNNHLYHNTGQAYYVRCQLLNSGSRSFWDESASNVSLYREMIAGIIYHDNMQNSSIGTIISQKNSLLKHFDSDYPNKYWLAPTEIGIQRFLDTEFAPLGVETEDSRYGSTFGTQNGNWVMKKFRQNSSKPAYEDDVLVYMYRGADLYFMMAEAFNQLGKIDAVNALINVGIDTYKDKFDVDADGVYSGTWNGFTPNWANVSTYYYGSTTPQTRSADKADIGIRGSIGRSAYSFTNDIKENDELILREMMLEMACEGKVYPAMIRMARRYNDPSIMAKYIGEKYEGKGNAEAIRAKIMNGDYFIHWDLNTETEE